MVGFVVVFFFLLVASSSKKGLELECLQLGKSLLSFEFCKVSSKFM